MSVLTILGDLVILSFLQKFAVSDSVTHVRVLTFIGILVAPLQVCNALLV